MLHRSILSLLAIFFTSAGYLAAQTPIYLQPTIPAPKDLERMNLNMAWKAFLPMDNRGDSIVSVQVFEENIFVQLRSGPLVALSAKTGETLWTVALPKKYAPVLPVAANDTMIFVANGPNMYYIERKTGKLLVSTELPSMSAVPPVADISAVYLPLTNNRIVSYGYHPEDIIPGTRVYPKPETPDPPSGINTKLQSTDELSTTKNLSPSVNMLQSLRPPFIITNKDVSPSVNMLPSLQKPYRLDTGNRTPSVSMNTASVARLEELSSLQSKDRPKFFWELHSNRTMEFPVLIFDEYLAVSGNDRTIFSCGKFGDRYNRIIHEFKLPTNIAAPISQYGPEMYIPLADSNIHVVSIENFRNPDLLIKPLRSFTASSGLDRKPYVTDDSVYIAASTTGTHRLNRRTLEKVWHNREMDRVLTVNPNFIYGLDRTGNLLILDKVRGLQVSSYNIRSFSNPVVNEQDDRLYLASSSGMLLCLHDRSFPRAEGVKKKEPKAIVVDPRAVPKKEEPKKEDPKKEDPKKEDPKKVEDPKKMEDPKKGN